MTGHGHVSKVLRTMGETVSLRTGQALSDAVPFVKTFLASEAFKTLFREGMGLVEATAVYLDGTGRDESKLLGREASLAYATESMRLTTRLMQVASWLLVQRAVAEGELTPEQARNEKNRVRLADTGSPNTDTVFQQLPQGLQDLVAHSLRLMLRIRHLEGLMDETGPAAPDSSPVALQLGRLSEAFCPQA
jgi:regulator of CtrA degradation